METDKSKPASQVTDVPPEKKPLPLLDVESMHSKVENTQRSPPITLIKNFFIPNPNENYQPDDVYSAQTWITLSDI